jgi:hypothetical protein
MGRSPLLDRGGITGQELRLALVGPRLDDAGVRSSRTVAVVRCSTDRCLVRSGLLPARLAVANLLRRWDPGDQSCGGRTPPA